MRPILIDAHNASPMTGRGNNTYLLVAANDSVLIDAGVGHPAHLAELDRQLVDHAADLRRVLVTHGHGDHASGAPALAAVYPQASFEKYPWPDEDRRHAVAWHQLKAADTIAAGAEKLAVLHTPGHSPDHLAFWHEPSSTIFTGDLVVA